MDVVELYRRTTDVWLSRVEQIGSEQWTAPTPCTEWDVRALVNHVVGEQLWLPPLMDGATIAEVGDRFDGDLLGAEPDKVIRSAAEDAAAAVPAAIAEQRIVHISFGDTPAAEYTYQLAADQLIHAWDLAVAIGADRELDPEAVAAVADWYPPQEAGYREGGYVGPRPDGPHDGTQAELLAGFGRRSDWS